MSGDPTIGVAVKMGAHVSENNVWHVWLGVYPSVCESPYVTILEGVSRDFLGPLRCLCHGRRVWVVPLKHSNSSKVEAHGVWVWKKPVHQLGFIFRPWGEDLRNAGF